MAKQKRPARKATENGLPGPLAHYSRAICRDLSQLTFSPPVFTVYNPLEYARIPYEEYLERFAASKKRVLLLGMNPGPWGMAQTGIPFGEIGAARDWMGIRGRVQHPPNEHPKRVIEGYSCTRSEVSGRRLWGLMQKRFTSPEVFFKDHFVANYCPLIFLEESGKNRTPEKLPAAEREPLFDLCDRLLDRTIALLEPEWLVGIGKFAEKRLISVAGAMDRSFRGILSITHPSPANPKANKGWEPLVLDSLLSAGVWDSA